MENGKNKFEEYDYKQIAILGKSFLDAAKICDNPKIGEVGWSHYLIVPIITNMSFACELFLKAILKHDEIQQKKIEIRTRKKERNKNKSNFVQS